MVIFVATREGFKELESVILTGEHAVWIGADVLSDKELESVRDAGVYVTNFLYVVDLNNKDVVDAALEDIALHHPDERVWLEWLP
ncbi:hypothetical protein [Bacterioplanoides sp. SCSIO 12839]|uniref:hypothetical protein n=1 Tax=Bacterioplanoides sp. SCSIO 12839 TaxID=2829569 RepID=UPI0021053343|nr:hypothetical protein [Bacterioplanoides sp. SCSIO 12839]UTW49282.1 hypothetical protein KFF03_05095 [Bacterioplanoides sp. SCSIO 12839]